MTEPQQPPIDASAKRPWWKSSTLKFFIVGFLVLIMCIPLALVNSLVWERKGRYETVQKDISEHWGQTQGVIGPVIFVPFSPGPKAAQQYVVLLPDNLKVTGKLVPEVRQRGIFQTVVYTSHLELQADFSPLKTVADATGPIPHPLWQNATVGLSLNDPKGLLSGTQLTVNGGNLPLLQSAENFSGIQASFPAAAQLSQGKSLHLKWAINLNGSRALGISPVGKQTLVTLAGSYGKPSFNGAYLPSKRTVTDEQFTADWDVSHLARRIPQLWRQPVANLPVLDINPLIQSEGDRTGAYSNYGDSASITDRLRNSGFGVTLMEPVDAYKQTERSLKYGILFLSLTFLTYFLFERLTRANIHLLQYVMVGLALSLFYLIVLSVSELLGFTSAYVLGTAATVALISYYSAGFIPKRQQWIMPVVLTGIYAYLFSLLQLEDLSLLFGTIGLFAILAVLMMVTRGLHKDAD
jgi:inner membrane protein